MVRTDSITVVVVDDEPHARRRIKQLLKREADFEVVGEEGNGTDAIATIKRTRPGVVFLDVQMPEADGFDVVGAIDPSELPYVVFVTAYDEYALRAFDVHAFDYLLKPFSQMRFHEAIQRIREDMTSRGEPDRRRALEALLREVRADREQDERLTIKSGGRIFFAKSSEISWIESSGNYVVLHIGDRKHLVRHTLTSMQAMLSSKKFIRVHRSWIVNIDHAREIHSSPNGGHCIVMKDGARVPVSRQHHGRLADLF